MKLWLPKRIETIGYEPTHTQWWDVSFRVIETLFAKELSPIVNMQPQQGKTGVMATLIWTLIQIMHRNNATCQFNIISALPDRALLRQTQTRLDRISTEDGTGTRGFDLVTEANSKRVTIGNDGFLIHNGSIRLRHIPEKPTNTVVWIIDEIHQRNNRNSVIDTMLRRHGVYINKRRSLWQTGRQKHLLIGVSATAFAHACVSVINGRNANLDDRSLFDSIFVKPEKGYTSPGDLLGSGRVLAAEPLFDGYGCATEFAVDRLIKFTGVPNRTFSIMRQSGRKHESVLNFLEGNSRAPVIQIDCANNNIIELQNILAQKPKRMTHIILKNAARAGITFGEAALRNIGQWIDVVGFSKVDSVVQSAVGRTCGYGFRGDFNIYVGNPGLVEKYVRYYVDGLSASNALAIPTGLQNNSGYLHNSSRTVFRKYSPDHVEIITEEEWERRKPSFPKPSNADGRRSTVNGTEGFRRRDVVGNFLNGTANVTKWVVALQFIKAAPGYEESFSELQRRYPQYIGKDKTILLIPGEYGVVPYGQKEGSSLLKRRSALSSE